MCEHNIKTYMNIMGSCQFEIDLIADLVLATYYVASEIVLNFLKANSEV